MTRRQVQRVAGYRLGQRFLSLVQITLGDLQVAGVRRDQTRVVLHFLGVVAGLAGLCALRGTQAPLELLEVVGVLPPVTSPQVGAEIGSQFDDFARGVEQQADVGWVMHIGLNHERVATPVQDCVGLFFYEFMAGIDDDLVDLVQQFWGEQADVVLQCLVVVRGRIELSMAEHLAQGVVLVDQFVQTVVIDVQVKADDAADEDRPERHARTSVSLVDCWRQVGFKQFKELRTRARVLVQVLQPTQNLWNVVA